MTLSRTRLQTCKAEALAGMIAKFSRCRRISILLRQ